MFSNVKAIFKREFRAYFDSPVAYVFLTAFLALIGFMTFGVAMFYERRQADLSPFFFWHPWVYLLLVPATTMGLWAEERRSGTIEQLLTLPINVMDALVGKFLAAWSFLGIALVLTAPIVFTAGYLGSPDWGAVVCGYVGSFMLAGAATAIGIFASALSRSSVVGFVISLVFVFLLLLVGFDPVTGAVAGWGVPSVIVDGIAGCSLLKHYTSLQRGVIDLADIGYYFGVMVLFLIAAKTVIEGRRGASRSVAAIGAIFAIIVAAIVLVGALPLRVDLTAEKLYTLSKGSKAVFAKLDKEVTLKYFVSSSASDMPTQLKTYASQVENLLDEYSRAAAGNLNVEKYDPKPDSDAEEWAQRYGIEPQTVNPFGSPIYFGLTAVCGDREETLGTLSPRTESTLEYDITRLVTRVAWPERPVIGVMTSLEGVLAGAPNPMMMQQRRQTQGWAAFDELAKDYEVRAVEPTAEKIDADVKTLVVLHAKDLTDKTLYAIDQFVLRGGRLIACVDSMSFKDFMASRANQQQMMMGGGMPEPSTLGKLFDAWGVKFESSKITCDLMAATKLNNGQGGVEDEPAFLTLGARNMAKGDLLVHGLSTVMMPFAGSFEFVGGKAGITFTPVITTSTDRSGAMDRMALMMGGGSRETRPDGKARVVAARLEGEFDTAYPQGPDGTNTVAGAVSKGNGMVMLFADSDFLADDFCVRMLRTPFGNMAQPMNDNLALFSNVIERFAGREELIGMRTRGISNRPFEVVDRLEAKAMEKWQKQEEQLQGKLREAQQRIDALQRQKSGNDAVLLSREQQAEIIKFRKAQADTRKQLKNVRKQLTADIDSLGRTLKCINIILMPLLVAAVGLFRALKHK